MIYENSYCKILRHESNIPWLEIHAKAGYKELCEDSATSFKIFQIALAIEQAMIEFYRPAKINHASFANYLPKAHWHVMARFADDGFYPESMWGKRQSQGLNHCENFAEFINFLLPKLEIFS